MPQGAELILPDEHISRSNWLGDLPPTTIAGLNRLGISTERWMGNHTLRCRESFILPDEQVYVLGTAHAQHDAKKPIENSSGLYIGSSQDHAFIISDRSEKELLSRLQWQVAALGVGGLTLATTCLILIFTYYVTTAS
jgi:hypothetical protein